jgi:hypothetical protein
MKTYVSKFVPKNKKKYNGNADNITARSSWERNVFIWCDNNKDIVKWSSEEVIIPYHYEVDKRTHRYFPDVFIEMKNGDKLLVEIKPDKETRPPQSGKKTKRYLNEAMIYVKNMNKWAAAEKYAKDHGWKFEVWTEKTLQKMKIMPRKPKSLPQMKPLRKRRSVKKK